MMRRILARPAAVQAAFYLAGGAWPLIAYRSFELVTGAKREPWLVKTVALITVVIGGVLATDPAGTARQTRLLGVGTAAAYTLVDAWYAGIRSRIRPVYLLDAVAEAALVVTWLARRRT